MEEAVQFQKIHNIESVARAEEQALVRYEEERKEIVTRIAYSTWRVKTFPDEQSKQILDPLLARKYRTQAGGSSIRLEKLLLELDKVETMGNDELRSRRKEVVKYVQELLSKADVVNTKARKLIHFQDKLALISKSPKQHKEIHSKRKFSAENAINSEDLGTSPPKRKLLEEKTVEKSTVDETVVDDSVDSVARAQEHADRIAEEYYQTKQRNHEEQAANTAVLKEAASSSKKNETSDDENEDDEMEEEETSRQTNVMNRKQTVPKMTQKVMMKAPKVQIEELSRAFVLLCNDVNAEYAKVSLSPHDGILRIAIPGRAPVKYSIGSNINYRQVTKEVIGNTLRIVLPKITSFPMRTGRRQELFDPLSSNFWSRF